MSNLNEIVRGNAANVFSETIQNDNVYEILDKTEGGLTNAQMEFALANIGYVKLGSVYLCTDDGTYTQKHFYKFTTSGWEDVTPTSEECIPKISGSNLGRIPVIDEDGNLYASNKKLSEIVVLEGSSDPTTTTKGAVNQLYKNTTTNALFICVSITTGNPNTYTWQEIAYKSYVDSAIASAVTTALNTPV